MPRAPAYAFTVLKTACAVMRAPQTRPPLLTRRNTGPLVNSALVIQPSSAAFAQLGMGTERTRVPLPTRSTITQRPSRCWMCSRVSEAVSSRRRLSGEEVEAALQEQALELAPGSAAATSEHVLLLLPVLRLLQSQHKEIARRIETVLEGMEQQEQEGEHRDVTILRSMPGAGRVVAATMLAEASEALAEREYRALRSYTGVAPVTWQSGKRKAVGMRRSCNPRLRNAVYHWSMVSIQHDERSREHHTALRKKGHSHSRALRGVADRLLAVLTAMLRTGSKYDPTLRSAASRQ